MSLYIGITDGEWHRQLAAAADLDEVNFWQPSGGPHFKALKVGGLFLFKLHAPKRAIVGGGVFAAWSPLPVSLAWESFGTANGARTLVEMRRRIERYRRTPPQPHEDYEIGCILLEQPFFFPESDWIPSPPDWHPNIQVGKGYGLDTVAGRRLWSDVQERLGRLTTALPLDTFDRGERYGDPIVIRPRLGQGTFRVLVTDAYDRRCAVTRERTLPALEAAHIRPYGDGGEHRVDNGLLLRRDLHALFDRGYLTVTPALRLAVSRRIREDFENGRDYYALDGRELVVPAAARMRPEEEFLRWHREERWLG
jgi:putative restriction endonuclease